MPGDIRIENKDDLEKWLNSLPEDIRQQAATAIASRAALRVLPVLENWLAKDKEKSFSIVLRTFRATATTWIALVEARHSVEIRKAVYAVARTADITAHITLYSLITQCHSCCLHRLCCNSCCFQSLPIWQRCH